MGSAAPAEQFHLRAQTAVRLALPGVYTGSETNSASAFLPAEEVLVIETLSVH
jgi:hypothetical protein